MTKKGVGTYKGLPCEGCGGDIRYRNNDDCWKCLPRTKESKPSKGLTKEQRYKLEEHQQKWRDIF